MAKTSTADGTKQMEKITPADTIKTTPIQDFFKLIKVGVVNSNLITTLSGIWLALHFNGKSFIDNIDLVLLTMIGSAFIIAGSLSLNNYIDRDIDHLMERTKSRPTVTGKVKPHHVLIMGIVFVIIGTVTLALTTITSAIYGVIGAFSYVVLYTLWTKRYFTFNTIVGSISGAVPPLIGWAAIDPKIDLMAWVLFLIIFIWQPPHVYSIAMKRCEEYRKAGVPMLPVVYGFEVTKRKLIKWIICLFPLPFLLYPLGIPFLLLATILNIGWVIMWVKGNKMKDEIKWANKMFLYSVNYLTILFIAMIVATFL